MMVHTRHASRVSPLVAAAVLGAAVLHAIWNALAKLIPDRLVASALIGTGFTLVGIGWVWIAPPPAPASWPYLATSAVLQTLYVLLLTAAYAHGDFSRTYPIARGIAPVVVTAVAVGLLGEHLTPAQLAGVALVVIALIALGAAGRSLGLALATGVVIGGYSLVDGVGVRLADSVTGYTSWQLLLHGPLLVLTAVALARGTARLRGLGRRITATGLIGGLLSVAAYAIVLWAQSRAPLSLVAALRETSVLLAAAIGAVVFRERFGPRRILATVAVTIGIVLTQWGHG